MAVLDVVGIVLLTIAGLLFLALQSWLAATVVRRVVGVPIGWPRSITVGFVMSAAMGLTVQYLFRAATGQNPGGLNVAPTVAVLFLILAVGWIFALGVGALVFIEAAFPTGSLPGFSQVFTGWKARRRRTRRYADVTSIAVRHGLGSRLRGFGQDDGFGQDAKTAKALRNALNEAGVTFIKLGQMLSTRRDLLPETYIRELESLQSHASPEPWEAIERALLERLGRPLEEVFSHVNPVPLAAASVAQVHQATLLDGTEVVLKIQRPGALGQVALDMDIILRLARWLNKTTPWGKSLGVHALARGFADSLEEELDYRIELDNMRSIERSLGPVGRVRRRGSARLPGAFRRTAPCHGHAARAACQLRRCPADILVGRRARRTGGNPAGRHARTNYFRRRLPRGPARGQHLHHPRGDAGFAGFWCRGQARPRDADGPGHDVVCHRQKRRSRRDGRPHRTAGPPGEAGRTRLGARPRAVAHPLPDRLRAGRQPEDVW